MTSTLSNQTNRIGDKLSLQVKATQVENDSLTYDVENLSVGLNIDPDTGLISGTVDHNAATGTPNAVTRQRQGHQSQHEPDRPRMRCSGPSTTLMEPDFCTELHGNP